MSVFDALRESVVLRGVASVSLSVFNYLYGPADFLLFAFMTMMGLDLASKIFSTSIASGGFFKAIHSRELSSKAAFYKTLIKIVRYSFMIIGVNLLMSMLPETLVYGNMQVAMLGRYAIFAYCGLIEFLSILENMRGIEGDNEIEPLRKALNPDRILDRLIDRLIDRIADKIGQNTGRGDKG